MGYKRGKHTLIIKVLHGDILETLRLPEINGSSYDVVYFRTVWLEMLCSASTVHMDVCCLFRGSVALLSVQSLLYVSVVVLSNIVSSSIIHESH